MVSITGGGARVSAWGEVTQPEATPVAVKEGVMERLPVTQGSLPACGAVALHFALQHLGLTVPWESLDRRLRAGGPGTSEGTIVEEAQRLGLQAGLYNRGSFEALAQATAQGDAVLAMVDVGSYDGLVLQPGSNWDSAWHWLNVTRAFRDAQGQRWVEFENPWGTRERLTYEHFETCWDRLQAGGLPMGYDKAYVRLARPTAPPLPPSQLDGIDGLSQLTKGSNDVMRGFGGEGLGRVLEGVWSVLTAIPKAIDNLLRAIFGGA